MSDRELPKGFTCEVCSKEHTFPPYVYAHWDEALCTTCECGTEYSVFKGRVFKESTEEQIKRIKL